MWLSEGSLGIDEGPSSRKFVVNLIVNEGRNPAVRSCELIGKGFRNRTSFGADTDVEAVFVKEVEVDEPAFEEGLGKGFQGLVLLPQ